MDNDIILKNLIINGFYNEIRGRDCPIFDCKECFKLCRLMKLHEAIKRFEEMFNEHPSIEEMKNFIREVKNGS